MAKQNNVKKALDAFSKFVRGVRPKITFDEKGHADFSIEFIESHVSDQTLDSVIDLHKNLAGSKRPYIIIMDEFQDIQKLNGMNFENLLRSKIQHHQYVNYLFLGSRTHMLRDMFTNKNRPFYNSAATMSIGELPQNETIQFLISRFSQSNISLDENTASLLIKKAEKIPYYIQFLASEVWQYTIDSTKTVTREIIDFCIDRILDMKNDFYLELFDHQTAYQKRLLKALAINGRNIFSNDYARRFRLSAVSTTQKAIRGLTNSGIIEKEGNDYTFSDPFFRLFILRLSA